MNLVIHHALQSLFLPQIRRLVVLCMVLSSAALIAFISLAHLGIEQLTTNDSVWWTTPLEWLGTLGAGVLAWFLFPAVMPLIANLFMDRAARHMEAAYYPEAQGTSPPWAEDMVGDLRFMGKSLMLNLLCLPFYMVPVVNLFVYFALNSYLLGREWFEEAAKRYVGRTEAIAMRKQHATYIRFLGMVIALCTTIPVVNLVSPFIAFALMMHAFHALRASA